MQLFTNSPDAKAFFTDALMEMTHTNDSSPILAALSNFDRLIMQEQLAIFVNVGSVLFPPPPSACPQGDEVEHAHYSSLFVGAVTRTR